jgi:type IV pilus assembly protein PilW
MRQIVSVRVALVVRGEYYDLNGGTPALPNPVTTSLTFFTGLTDTAGNPLQQTINFAGANRQFRYRVFEFTVPLRNMLLLAGGP